MSTRSLIVRAVLSVLLCTAPLFAQAERIKDIASLAGVRNNQLVGYGIVVGLDGTGDQTSQAPFTTQSLISMLGSSPPGSESARIFWHHTLEWTTESAALTSCSRRWRRCAGMCRSAAQRASPRATSSQVRRA